MGTEQPALPEALTNPENPTYSFTIVRPGGNDTCLIDGIVEDPSRRKLINDAIMGLYPSVEQVGFIDLTPGQERLQMAGGEFCGNATRSTAFLALGGQPGTIELTVSGVSRPLTAGVRANGDAFAQMPVYGDLSKVRPVGVMDRMDVMMLRVPGATNFIVEMEGITQYIDFNAAALRGRTPEQIKDGAMETIKALELDRFPAAGIMYTEKRGDSWAITPVVYVRDIDTLFLETACGSGTTAVGMALARVRGGSVRDVSVIQPTGTRIDVDVDFERSVYRGARIGGPVEILERGRLEFDKGGTPFVLERISDRQQVDRALESGEVVRLYQDVFAKPPYEEVFSDTDVRDIFTQYAENGLVFLARSGDGIIGFSAAVPLRDVPDVAAILQGAGIPVETASYMADLGVADASRRKGVGKQLVEAVLTAVRGEQVTVRTSENNLIALSLYRSLGFTPLPGITQEISGERTDGEIRTDRRVFLSRKA